MYRVELVTDKKQWNQYLNKCINTNIFSSWEWGEYKSSSWNILRLSFYKKDTFVGITQISIKSIFGFKVCWGASGICLTDYKYLQHIIDKLSEYFDLNRTIIRFNFFDKISGDISFFFDEISLLQRVKNSINSGYTVRFEMDSFEKNNVKQYDSNARYYLKKSQKEELRFQITEIDISVFEKIHSEMARIKKKENLIVSVEELREVNKHFKGYTKMGKVLVGDETVSACFLIEKNDCVYYFLAGSNKVGREKYASFYMVHSLLNYYKGTEIKIFDFGGISPFLSSVKGINRFKRGFGGETVKYIGERDLTNSKLLKIVFQILINYKFRDRG